MSKREELRKRRQQRARRQQLIMITGVVVVALGITSYLVFQNTRPIGGFTTIEKETYVYADGKAQGSVEAQVVIQEFSDFQ